VTQYVETRLAYSGAGCCGAPCLGCVPAVRVGATSTGDDAGDLVTCCAWGGGDAADVRTYSWRTHAALAKTKAAARNLGRRIFTDPDKPLQL
jgi:hypothetical protein